MTHAGNSTIALQVGVEIECLIVLQDSPPASEDPEAVYKHIVSQFNDNRKGKDVKDSMALNSSAEENCSRSWAIGNDISIRGSDDESNSLPRVPILLLSILISSLLFLTEIVSPILDYEDKGWEETVRTFWWDVGKLGEIGTNDTCGTHLHFSPKAAPWGLQDLKRLSIAIMWFETAFEVLFPDQGNRIAG